MTSIPLRDIILRVTTGLYTQFITLTEDQLKKTPGEVERRAKLVKFFEDRYVSI